MPMTVFVAPGPMEVKASIGSTGGAVVAVGEVDGGLLVHDLHGADPSGQSRSASVSVQKPWPGMPAACAHALADQVFDDDLCAGQALRGCAHLASIRYHANDYIAAL